MLQMSVEIIKPNKEILELLKHSKYEIKNGMIKTLNNTNLKFICPIEYIITFPISITIYEYKVNEISNKNFYIKEYKQKYNFNEIKKIIGCKIDSK